MITMAIGAIQFLFFIPSILAFMALVYVLFFDRGQSNVDIPLIIQIPLYFISLVPLGLLVGLFIELKERRENGVKKYKYSQKVRENATLIILISIVSTLLSLYNWTYSN